MGVASPRLRSIGRSCVEWLLPAMVWATAALFAATPIYAVDFFWHLKLGALIAADGRIPTVDTFSAVHPERPYVQLQWLWELAAHGVVRAWGLFGMRAAQVVVCVLGFVALWRALSKILSHRAQVFLVCAAALVLFEDRMQVRPSATALLLLALSLPVMLAEVASRSPRTLVGLFTLGTVWSNLHGGEAMLLPLCLGARALGTLLEPRRPERSAQLRGSAAQTLSALLGVATSPTWLPGMRSWSLAIGPQLASGNQEWLPSYTMLRYGIDASHVLIALGPSVVAALWLADVARRRTRRAYGAWALGALLLVLAHHAVRNAFLCIVPLTQVLRHGPGWRRSRWGRRERVAAGAGALLMLSALHNHITYGYGGLAEAREGLRHDLAPNVFPEELATFMRDARIEGGVFNDGRWGGYLIWRLWPRCSVFADTRQNLTADMWPLLLAAQASSTRPPAMQEAFARWGLELAVFRGPVFPLLRPEPAWQLLYKAGDQELYQHRAGAHAARNIARTRAWLARAGGAPGGGDLTEAAVAVGARHWLAAPYRRWQAARAAQLRASPDEAAQLRGLEIQAGLQYDAGQYAPALVTLQALLARAPAHPLALYRSTLASYALGRIDAARADFLRLRPHVAALSHHQRERLVVLGSALVDR